ncbi:hypothetical protein C8Q75DRAFT_732010 [Abortiporus biennis]|nr:hypothetical protein C8Q75DRAFT_732010 [Abortiporus biennis]
MPPPHPQTRIQHRILSDIQPGYITEGQSDRSAQAGEQSTKKASGYEAEQKSLANLFFNTPIVLQTAVKTLEAEKPSGKIPIEKSYPTDQRKKYSLLTGFQTVLQLETLLTHIQRRRIYFLYQGVTIQYCLVSSAGVTVSQKYYKPNESFLGHPRRFLALLRRIFGYQLKERVFAFTVQGACAAILLICLSFGMAKGIKARIVRVLQLIVCGFTQFHVNSYGK